MNPQFQVELGAPDTNEKEGMLVIGLMQKDDRQKRLETQEELTPIGYFLFDASFLLFCLVLNTLVFFI